MSKMLFAKHEGNHVLKFVGDIRVNLCPTLKNFLEQIGSRGEKAIVIDLTETTCMDSTTLGFLAKIALASQEKLGVQPTLVTPNPDVTRVIRSTGFEQIFLIIDHAIHTCDDALEMPTHVMAEELLREQVLDAHRTLMKMNDHNFECFRDLVEALEAEISAETDSPRNPEPALASQAKA